jgi:hypothetical protein
MTRARPRTGSRPAGCLPAGWRSAGAWICRTRRSRSATRRRPRAPSGPRRAGRQVAEALVQAGYLDHRRRLIGHVWQVPLRRRSCDHILVDCNGSGRRSAGKTDKCLRIGQREIGLRRNPDQAAQAEAVSRSSGESAAIGLGECREDRGGVLGRAGDERQAGARRGGVDHPPGPRLPGGAQVAEGHRVDGGEIGSALADREDRGAVAAGPEGAGRAGPRAPRRRARPSRIGILRR